MFYALKLFLKCCRRSFA